jgi:DNA-binding transcriptional LysR family regulator
VFIPKLPELIAEHPQLEVQLSTTDRRVDVIREGFDCVLRIGKLDDSGLITRKLGELPMMNVASPGYLKKYGKPKTLDDLDAHLIVHYSIKFGTETPGFEYRDGTSYRERPMRSVITVNATDAYRAAAIAGLGIVQIPQMGADLATGQLVEVLPQYVAEPLAVYIVHAHGRSVPRHVRAVMSWIADQLDEHLD